MGEISKIEWTDATFNPWVGCTKVSPACDHCYAESWAKRSGDVKWGQPGERGERRKTKTWGNPVKWNRQHDKFFAAHGRRRRVFCASLADVFDNQVPKEWRDELWQLIRETPNLDWLLLTKRPQNIKKMLPNDWGDGWPNVWLGTTIENRETADQRAFHLSRVPAQIRFWSMEPLLEDLGYFLQVFGPMNANWIIVGGESGANARHMDADWARSVRDQCREAGVAFFMKQMTKKALIPDDLLVREFPLTTTERA